MTRSSRTTRRPGRRRDVYGSARAGNKRPRPPRNSGGGQRRNAEGLIVDDRYDWQPTASFSRSGQGSAVDTPPADRNAAGGIAQPMTQGPAMQGATPAMTSGLTFGANVPTVPLPQGLYSALALDPRRRRLR